MNGEPGGEKAGEESRLKSEESVGESVSWIV